MLIKAFDNPSTGFVNSPVAGGSTVLFRNASEMLEGGSEFSYGTHGTPIVRDLSLALTLLEKAATTVLASSGLAALTLAFLCALRPGDRALVIDSVYEPLRQFCNGPLAELGIATDYFDPKSEISFKSMLKAGTRLVHLESPASGTLEMLQVGRICEYVKIRNSACLVSMDNSWATALAFKPLDHGVDMSVNALTKYPCGASDVVMGSVSANARMAGALVQYHAWFGACAGDYESYVVLKALKTAKARLVFHYGVAVRVAAFLETEACVDEVFYPAVSGSPYYKI